MEHLAEKSVQDRDAAAGCEEQDERKSSGLARCSARDNFEDIDENVFGRAHPNRLQNPVTLGRSQSYFRTAQIKHPPSLQWDSPSACMTTHCFRKTRKLSLCFFYENLMNYSAVPLYPQLRVRR